LLYSLQTQNQSPFPAKVVKTTNLNLQFESHWDLKFITPSIIMPTIQQHNYHLAAKHVQYT
jgi:hypothetical protein